MSEVGAPGANPPESVRTVSYSPQSPLIDLQEGQDLDQIIASVPGTVLLDFYADWCGPCKKQAVVLHQLEPTAAQHQAAIIKIDVEKHPKLQRRFNATALPTLVVMQGGQPVHRKRGLTERSQLAQWIAQ